MLQESNTDVGLFGITGSRYIYDLYYEKEAISKKLYDWLLKNNYADANLIAKWKKQGYEKVIAPSPKTTPRFHPLPPLSRSTPPEAAHSLTSPFFF